MQNNIPKFFTLMCKQRVIYNIIVFENMIIGLSVN